MTSEKKLAIAISAERSAAQSRSVFYMCMRVCHLVSVFFRWVTSHSSNHGYAVFGKLGGVLDFVISVLEFVKTRFSSRTNTNSGGNR